MLATDEEFLLKSLDELIVHETVTVIESYLQTSI